MTLFWLDRGLLNRQRRDGKKEEHLLLFFCRFENLSVLIQLALDRMSFSLMVRSLSLFSLSFGRLSHTLNVISRASIILKGKRNDK